LASNKCIEAAIDSVFVTSIPGGGGMIEGPSIMSPIFTRPPRTRPPRSPTIFLRIAIMRIPLDVA
jgi:hypothetical protein